MDHRYVHSLIVLDSDYDKCIHADNTVTIEDCLRNPRQIVIPSRHAAVLYYV